MRRLVWILALLSATALAQSEPPLTPDEAVPIEEAAPSDDLLPAWVPPPRTYRNRLPDLTAEVLQPGEGQFNLFFLQYSRGILPGLQLSAHLGGYLVTLLNLTAEYQLVERRELRVSIQGGAYWFALSQFLQTTVVQAHLMPRMTVPLAHDLELNVGANLRLLLLGLPGISQNTRDLRAELTLLRYDAHGAWVLEGRFPLLTHQGMRLDELLGQVDVEGSLLLDDLGSWGVVLSRDFVFGDTSHLRVGAGYRNRPGILLVDSIGNLVLQFDVYWR